LQGKIEFSKIEFNSYSEMKDPGTGLQEDAGWREVLLKQKRGLGKKTGSQALFSSTR